MADYSLVKPNFCRNRQGINGKAMARAGNPIGAPLFSIYHNSTLSAGATSTEIIAKAEFSFKVVRACIHLTEAPAGGASEDVYLANGSNAFTDTLDYSAGSDDYGYEFSKYIAEYKVFHKGDLLKLVKTGTAVTSFEVFIECVRI